MRRPRAAPVRVSSALTRRLPWYALAAIISAFLFANFDAWEHTAIAKLDFIPRSAESDTSLLTAVIAFGAVVIYCVKRNNPASADADAEMVPADAIANPTLFKRLLNA